MWSEGLFYRKKAFCLLYKEPGTTVLLALGCVKVRRKSCVLAVSPCRLAGPWAVGEVHGVHAGSLGMSRKMFLFLPWDLALRLPIKPFNKSSIIGSKT